MTATLVITKTINSNILFIVRFRRDADECAEEGCDSGDRTDNDLDVRDMIKRENGSQEHIESGNCNHKNPFQNIVDFIGDNHI